MLRISLPPPTTGQQAWPQQPSRPQEAPRATCTLHPTQTRQTPTILVDDQGAEWAPRGRKGTYERAQRRTYQVRHREQPHPVATHQNSRPLRHIAALRVPPAHKTCAARQGARRGSSTCRPLEESPAHLSSGARAHGGPASRPYRPPVPAHVRQTTIRVRVEKKIGRRDGTQTHRLSTAKLYGGKPGLRGSDATPGRWQVRRGSSSRTNLRRPIRAGKRRPKSYAGAEAIIAQAMAQGMAGRMHGRMAGAAPMHLVETVTCMGW